MSPVWNQPSPSMAASVAAASRRYPRMTCGPRITISPSPPGGSGSPDSMSTTRHSVPGIGGPTEPGFASIPGPSGGRWVTGLVSVRP